MSVFLYTDSGKTQTQMFSTPELPFLQCTNGQYNTFLTSKKTDTNLGDLYFVTYGVYGLQWNTAGAQEWLKVNSILPETISDFYTAAGYRIEVGVTKTGDSTYTLSNALRIYKPDGTICNGGDTTSIDTSVPASSRYSQDKTLRLSIVKRTLKMPNGQQYPGYCIFLYCVQTTIALPPVLSPRWYANVWVSENFFTGNFPDDTGGIPQQPESGGGSFSAPSDTLTTPSASSLSTAMGGGGLTTGNHGVHAYELTDTALTEFCQKIYGAGSDTWGDLWQRFENYQYDPISGIIGALIVPVPAVGLGTPGINLSGQFITVTGATAISQRFTSTQKAVITIDEYYGSFADYAPYTKIDLFLPFIGGVSLNTNECMGGSIGVEYLVDVCTGACVAFVELTDRNGVTTYYNYAGNCGLTVPIGANDRGVAQFIAGATGMIGGIVSAVSGGAAGGGIGAIPGIIGAARGAAQMAMPQQHEKHVGSFSAGAGCMGYLCPFAVINRPHLSAPSDFSVRLGRMSNQSGVVGNYSAFTVFDWVDTSQIDGATDAEKQEIESILLSGVFL